MPQRIHLLRMALHCTEGQVVHTAASGPVAALDELRIVVEQDGALAGVGAAHVNIAYLTGLPGERLVAEALVAARALDWTRPWEEFAAALDRDQPGLPPAVRMLVEMLAVDAAAREAGRTLGVHLAAAISSSRSLPTHGTRSRRWRVLRRCR